MRITLGSVKDIGYVVLAAVGIIVVFSFSVTFISRERAFDCLRESGQDATCGVALLEEIKMLPSSAEGAQQAIIIFSRSVTSTTPSAQHPSIKSTLSRVEAQIDEASAECFRKELYDFVRLSETNRLAMDVGVQFIELVGTISSLERPLTAILSELDPTGDIVIEVLKTGSALRAPPNLEVWATLSIDSCSSD